MGLNTWENSKNGRGSAARWKETLQKKSCSKVIFFVFLRFTTLCWFRPFNVTRCKQMLLHVCYHNCVPALSQCECRKLNSIISLNLNWQLLPLISLSGFHTISDMSNSRRRKNVDSFYQTLTIKKGSVLNLTIKKKKVHIINSISLINSCFFHFFHMVIPPLISTACTTVW